MNWQNVKLLAMGASIVFAAICAASGVVLGVAAWCFVLGCALQSWSESR
jgi:hypothetical protein